jgi:hypothetical protein
LGRVRAHFQNLSEIGSYQKSGRRVSAGAQVAVISDGHSGVKQSSVFINFLYCLTKNSKRSLVVG